MSFENSVNQRGSNRFNLTYVPGVATNGYGITGS